MPAENYLKITGSLSGTRLPRFTAAVAALEAGRDAGSIANARYLEAKDSITRALEAGWDQGVIRKWCLNREYLAAADDVEQSALQDLHFSGTPAPHLMRAVDRRAEAIGDTPAGRDIRSFISEIRPLVDLLGHGKTIAVKRTPEVIAQEKAAASPMRIVSKGTADMILETLKEITAGARDDLIRTIRDRGQRLLDRFVEYEARNAAKPPGKDRRRRYGSFEFAYELGEGKANPNIRVLIRELIEEPRDTGSGLIRCMPRADHQEILTRLSETRTDELFADYMSRTLQKLAPIVEAKGNLDKIEVNGRHINPAGMDASLGVTFLDGAKFEARTSVVWSTSNLGKVFNRFPLTFHNVTLADGSSLDRPSEERLNTVFINPPAMEPEPETDDESPSPGM